MSKVRDDLFDSVGKNTSTAKPKVDDSIFDNALDLIQGVGSVASSMVAMVPQGYYMAGKVLTGTPVDEALKKGEPIREALTYEPRREGGKKVKKEIEDVLQKWQTDYPEHFAGDAEFMAKEAAKRGEINGPYERAYNTERTVGDMISNLWSPGIGPHMLPRRGIPRVEPPREIPPPELPKVDTTRLQQPDLGMQEAIPVAPEARDAGFRNPYILPEDVRARIEAELNPPTEQRVPGQGEIFTDVRPYEQGELLQGSPGRFSEEGVGARDKIPPRESQLTDVLEAPDTRLAGAREQSGMSIDQFTPKEDMAVKSPMDRIPYEPERQLEMPLEEPPKPIEGAKVEFERGLSPENATAAEKPGFARSAEEIMRARRWNKQSGAVDPEVILEGIAKVAGFVPRSLEAARDFLSRGIDSAMDRRDVLTRKVFQNKLDEVNKAIEALKPVPKKQLTLDMETGKPLGQTAIGRSQRGSVNLGDLWDHRRKANPEGHMGAIKEVAKQWQLDRRTSAAAVLKDLVPSVPLDTSKEIWRRGDNGKSMRVGTELNEAQRAEIGRLQDISENFKTGAKALTDKTISILAEGKKGSGELIKWVMDQEKIIDMARDTAIEAAIKGEKFIKGAGAWSRGFVRREWGNEGALTEWRNVARSNPKELIGLKEEWLSAMFEGRDPVFKTERQQRIFDAVQKQLEVVLDKVNEARKLVGYDPIEPIKSYFPSLWMGDYRLAVKDQMGNVKGYFARDNIYEAKKLTEMLRKEFPDMEVSDPYHVQRGKYDLDTSAFEEAMRVFGADDPAAKALRQAYSEIVGKRGFGGKRAIKKENILGFMGSEAGEVGVRSAEKALETYFKRMYTYEANLRKSQIAKSLVDLPTEVRSQLKNTMSLLNDYMVHARGGELEAMARGIDSFAQTLTKKTGFGESAAANILTDVKSIIGVYWLGTPKFIISQIPQHLNAMAKMVDLWQEGATNPVGAYFEGLKNTLKPDNIAMDAVNWARRRGYLDSVIVELLGSEIGSGSNTITSIIKKGTTYTLGKIEQEAVRVPSFLMFESQLRSSIRDPNKRFEAAAELMDHYMVNYRQAAKPMMYNHMGDLLGGSAAPLKQYSHNAFGQFFEYLQNTKDIKSAAPLATLMGTQALVGGLKGVILVAEANAIINLINFMGLINDPIPTVDEWLMTHGVSDSMTFGLASTITGHDVSASVSAPSGMSMFSLPPVAFGVDAMTAVGSYFLKKFKGVDTDYDALRAALAVTPNAAHAGIEKMFTGPNQPVPNPYTKQGNWIRSEEEWTRDIILGGRSVDEAKANALARDARRDILYGQAQKRDAIGAITDRIVGGKEVTPELIEKYIKEGGTPGGLKGAVENEIKRRTFTYMERQQMGKPSPGMARKQEIIGPKRDASPQVRRDLFDKISDKDFTKGMIYSDTPQGTSEAAQLESQRGLGKSTAPAITNERQKRERLIQEGTNPPPRKPNIEYELLKERLKNPRIQI